MVVRSYAVGIVKEQPPTRGGTLLFRLRNDILTIQLPKFPPPSNAARSAQTGRDPRLEIPKGTDAGTPVTADSPTARRARGSPGSERELVFGIHGAMAIPLNLSHPEMTNAASGAWLSRAKATWRCESLAATVVPTQTGRSLTRRPGVSAVKARGGSAGASSSRVRRGRGPGRGPRASTVGTLREPCSLYEGAGLRAPAETAATR